MLFDGVFGTQRAPTLRLFTKSREVRVRSVDSLKDAP